ncbi:hypothetical protein POM88_047393 [Heracleum sosnowskyi]|uniref:Uncharacterized protein n=1 Tax=Heracleum sosnowskyi TaxID=360622 RepID=A0AAD8LZL4_9APIA|nr:hypothetical protein POM88_047393 [Heracleum sosnowskyi]
MQQLLIGAPINWGIQNQFILFAGIRLGILASVIVMATNFTPVLSILHILIYWLLAVTSLWSYGTCLRTRRWLCLDMMVLNLAGNQILGEGSDLSGMASISFLNISNNVFQGSVVDVFQGPLEVIDLSNNQLQGHVSQELQYLNEKYTVHWKVADMRIICIRLQRSEKQNEIMAVQPNQSFRDGFSIGGMSQDILGVDFKIQGSHVPYNVADFSTQIPSLAWNKSEIEKRVHTMMDKFANLLSQVPENTKDSAGGPWEFVGLMPLFDPPRHDSAETTGRALEVGVSVKMITGEILIHIFEGY